MHKFFLIIFLSFSLFFNNSASSLSNYGLKKEVSDKIKNLKTKVTKMGNETILKEKK